MIFSRTYLSGDFETDLRFGVIYLRFGVLEREFFLLVRVTKFNQLSQSVITNMSNSEQSNSEPSNCEQETTESDGPEIHFYQETKKSGKVTDHFRVGSYRYVLTI